MKPITYKPNPDCEGGMEVHRYGKYVSESEYNELKAQVERLTKAGDNLERVLTARSGSYEAGNASHEWQSAKKGGSP